MIEGRDVKKRGKEGRGVVLFAKKRAFAGELSDTSGHEICLYNADHCKVDVSVLFGLHDMIFQKLSLIYPVHT